MLPGCPSSNRPVLAIPTLRERNGYRVLAAAANCWYSWMYRSTTVGNGNSGDKNTMIKISVMYPNDDGATFDIDYYCASHMALVRQLLGETLRGIGVDQGIGQPGSPAPFLAIGHLLFDSAEAAQSAINTHGPKLMADVPNYTNTQPTIQVSQIKM